MYDISVWKLACVLSHKRRICVTCMCNFTAIEIVVLIHAFHVTSHIPNENITAFEYDLIRPS